ncbi:MAG: hypothetical protein AAGE52_40925 [Myxococcota bacterium]
MIPEDALAAVRWLAHQAVVAQRWQVAQELLAGCMALSPDRWTALTLARVALAQADGTTARDAAADQLRRDPQDHDAAVYYARALLLLGERAEAARWLAGRPGVLAAAIRQRVG